MLVETERGWVSRSFVGERGMEEGEWHLTKNVSLEPNANLRFGCTMKSVNDVLFAI